MHSWHRTHSSRLLFDDLDAVRAGVEDVDRADLGELGGERLVARDRRVDLDLR